jgi:LuxR family transcriptional regulator, maltose regulon positive regulatory protein
MIVGQARGLDGGSPQALQLVWARLDTLQSELASLRQTLLELGGAGPSSGAARPLEPQTPAIDAWRVTMLGMFSVRRNGLEARLCSSRRGRSIFKFLLASPGYAASQDVLVETFWPSAEPATGAHNLQMAVHALRRSLVGWGPGGTNQVVLFRQDRYALNPALSIDQDVEHFRSACSRGRQAAARNDAAAARQAFEQARAMYAGGYLNDTPYEEWAASQRACLEDMQLSLLWQLSGLYVQAEDWDRAVTCCTDILAVDAYREDAYRQLMRCHAARGRRADVMRVFELCRARLRHDLQVEPTFETCRLQRELLDGGAR